MNDEIAKEMIQAMLHNAAAQITAAWIEAHASAIAEDPAIEAEYFTEALNMVTNSHRQSLINQNLR